MSYEELRIIEYLNEAYLRFRRFKQLYPDDPRDFRAFCEFYLRNVSN